MKAPPEQIVQKAHALINDLNQTRKELFTLHNRILTDQFEKVLDKAAEISGVHVLTVNLPEADKDSLRQLADRFRQKYESGIAVLASVIEDKPSLVAVVTKDLVAKGINAGDLINVVAEPLGGHGGGRPDLAQAGGKDPAKLETALKKVNPWIKKKLKS